MVRWRLFFVCLFSFTLLGCVAVKKSVDNYVACQGDSVCLEEMNAVRSSTYSITKAAAGPFLPSTPEVIAVIVSNVVAFGFGVFHGKKRS